MYAITGYKRVTSQQSYLRILKRSKTFAFFYSKFLFFTIYKEATCSSNMALLDRNSLQYV